MKKSPARRAVKFIAWSLATLLILLVTAIASIFLIPQKWEQNAASGKGSKALGRDFAIDGPIKIDWDWRTPYVHLTQLRLANMDGAQDPNMLTIDNLDFHIQIWKLLRGQLNLPDITLTHPHILLEKTADGQKNWDLPTFSKANTVAQGVVPSHRSNFPLIGAITIRDGQFRYKDATKNLDLTLAIDNAQGGDQQNGGQFILAGDGTLQNQKFRLDATGGSLDMLRNSDADYPLDLHIAMGGTTITAKGTYKDPVQMKDIDTTLDLRGPNLADLFYLTAIPLPPTPPYQLSGHLTRHNAAWDFTDFKGSIGQSDINGKLHDDTSGERSNVTAELNSKLLRVVDLSGFIGAKTQTNQPTQKIASDRLLPDMPLNLDRLRTTDMDVTLKAARIEQEGLPLEDLLIRFNLKDGVLRLDPFTVGIAGGVVSGPITLDGSSDVPQATFDLQLKRLSLKPFFTDSRFESFSSGHFGGRFKLAGKGDSLAKVLGDSNGRVTLLMSGGAISQLIIDAAGLDFGKAAPALLGNDQSTGIRCIIGDFGVTNGQLKSDTFLVDTTESNIHGTANINLKDETIDAQIEAHPKSVSLSARTPITISGKLNSPSIGLDPKEITARGAIAGALAVVLPPAAIIPFIEPGLGKDSDCQALIDAAHSHATTSPNP